MYSFLLKMAQIDENGSIFKICVSLDNSFSKPEFASVFRAPLIFCSSKKKFEKEMHKAYKKLQVKPRKIKVEREQVLRLFTEQKNQQALHKSIQYGHYS